MTEKMKPNCCLVTHGNSHGDAPLYWLVPTGDAETALEIAEDYHPQEVRALSGYWEAIPIIHPHPETIKQISGL